MLARIRDIAIIVFCIAVIALGCRITASLVDEHQAEVEARKIAVQVSLESAAHEAWKQATKFEIIRPSLLDAGREPPQNSTFGKRTVWVKSYQRSDAKSLGKQRSMET